MMILTPNIIVFNIEFLSRYRMSNERPVKPSSFASEEFMDMSNAELLPSSIDWRKHHAITVVKNQGAW